MGDSLALPAFEDSATLSGITVNNLRALRMDTPVAIRRLMLLVGRNGVGKSTFARVFPLLRQSARRRIREPLLWWDRDQVDFGSFQDALRRGSEAMSFAFSFRESDGEQWHAKTVLQAADQGCSVRQATVGFSDAELTINYGPSGKVESLAGNMLGAQISATPPAMHSMLLPFQAQPEEIFGVSDELNPVALLRSTNFLFHGNTDSTTKRRILLNLPWESNEKLIASLRRSPRGILKKRIDYLEYHPGAIDAIRRSRFCWQVVQRLQIAQERITDMAERTAYLGPFRAVPERTYRPQGVAVEQLDPRGANLALLVSALSESEKTDLDAYLSSSLGFTVSTILEGGSYSLQIRVMNQQFNLLDVGFGYSQLLPVALQLWASGRTLSTSRLTRRTAVTVIEQPELHLHPHQQVLVARAIAAIAAADSGPVQIIETHSDHIVGEIGMQIAKGKLPADRVAVICIEPHHDNGATVRTSHFDDEGVLQNWPAGFLSP